jgi:hypothetical protein
VVAWKIIKKLMNRSTIVGVGIGVSITLFGIVLPVDIQFVILVCTFLIMLSFLLIEVLTKTLEDKDLQILEINQDLNMRCLKVTMINNKSLEGEDLFKGIYKTLMKNRDFLNFGFQKIKKNPKNGLFLCKFERTNFGVYYQVYRYLGIFFYI